MPKRSVNDDLYLTLFNLSDNAILLLDGGKFIHCNPAFMRILKADNENMILNSHPADISPPTQADGQDSWIKAKQQIALAHKLGSLRFDWTHRRFNGEDFPAEVNLTAFKHNGKELIYAVIRDISDHNKTLDELRKSKKKAEESDNLKSAFLANMSHEIRTPLNAILGFSELLADERTEIEERKQFSDIIKKSTRQLLSIISDIFDISKLNADQFTIRPKPNNLQNVLKDVYSNFYSNFPEFQSECCRFVLDPLPKAINKTYVFDDERLVQLLNKLLDNACKFTECGQINLGVKYLGNHQARFHVKDTGVGIPSDKQCIIFEHFRQADEDLRRQIGGTGLGLAISKGIIELMGGEIGVISKPGKGSEFWFTLPLVLPDGIG